jgi:hypothetical protein
MEHGKGRTSVRSAFRKSINARGALAKLSVQFRPACDGSLIRELKLKQFLLLDLRKRGPQRPFDLRHTFLAKRSLREPMASGEAVPPGSIPSIHGIRGRCRKKASPDFARPA